MSDLVNQVMEERNKEYQDAWATTGEVIQKANLKRKVYHLLGHHPRMVFPWIMILNKLLRILGTPDKLDSWVDIAGYAQLIVNDFQLPKEVQK